jgi:hypothetical protein
MPDVSSTDAVMQQSSAPFLHVHLSHDMCEIEKTSR